MDANLALMWRALPGQTTNHPDRLAPLVEALEALGVRTKAVPWSEAAAGAVKRRLQALDGVMVWVNPLAEGQDRSVLDPLLAEFAAQGKWVSAHPDTIARMGVKDVLVRTAALSWGAEVRLYETYEAFREAFPSRLHAPRVLKPSRGNDGQGVWRVEALADGRVRVQPAPRDESEVLPLADFIGRLRPLFEHGGRLIEQAFQPRVSDGMVRCYLSEDRVVGFSEQFPRVPGPDAFAMASAKTMHGADAPRFQALRGQMEQAWTPGLQRLLEISTERLPAVWDADFLYGPKTAAGEDSFVLCEINVSSVLPFPPQAAEAIAQTAVRRLAEARGR